MAMAHMYIRKTSGGQEGQDKLPIFHSQTLKHIKMRKIKILGFIITIIIIFSGCEKAKDPAGVRNVGIVPIISDVNGIFINGSPTSFVQFKVDLEAGESVEKAEVEVSHQDPSTWAKFADVTTFPATFTITLSQVIDKLGIASTDIENGDAVFIGIKTTKNGITTRSNAALNITVSCEYDVAIATGSYHSISPDTDWNSEGDIKITADPEDPYTIYVAGLEEMEGLDEDQGPLVMHINPASFTVIADKTVIASDAWGDHNIAYSGSGTFNSCTGAFTMNFEISTDEAVYGTFSFAFTRNGK
jgi:hypothetical protein